MWVDPVFLAAHQIPAVIGEDSEGGFQEQSGMSVLVGEGNQYWFWL